MQPRQWQRMLLLSALVCLTAVTYAKELDYQLQAHKVAEHVYVFLGAQQHFSRDNGGNIVNTGFICTSEGAVVIDSGPSKLYGQQMRAQVLATCPAGITQLIITHAHPDHFLGTAAFSEADRGLPIVALASTRSAIASMGDTLTENLFRMVGDWMRGTYPVVPQTHAGNQSLHVGGREIELIALDGHTDGDLAVLDTQSGVLFAGDLVFFERTPTTPNANIARWLSSLSALESLAITHVVPGHGPVVHDPRAQRQTADNRAYTATQAANGSCHEPFQPENDTDVVGSEGNRSNDNTRHRTKQCRHHEGQHQNHLGPDTDKARGLLVH